MKKVLSIILAVIMCFSIAVISPYAEEVADTSAETTLKFNEDGSFKIMQVADLQDTANPSKKALEYVKEIAAEEKPDLFILTGDNISDSVARGFTKAHSVKKVRKAIDAFMSVFEEIGVPVAVIFGNHDAEGYVSKEEQMAIYNEYDCCIAIDEGERISGCGTYNLPILSSDESRIAYNLWLFDSNMYDPLADGYDHVHEDQIDWYVEKSNELKALNGGNPVPSMVFQHIIVGEIFNALVESEEGAPNAVQVGDKFLALPENATGSLLERPAAPARDSMQFEKMLEQGDVKAMFFGHDHKNDFVVPYMGIDLSTTPAAGFGGYGADNRGVRIIVLDEDNTDTYETETIHYLETCCTEPIEVMLYHIEGLKYIWDMFIMGLTIPVKSFIHLIT